eukprot:768187-Pelagomonas_calceolata.AAC.1
MDARNTSSHRHECLSGARGRVLVRKGRDLEDKQANVTATSTTAAALFVSGAEAMALGSLSPSPLTLTTQL